MAKTIKIAAILLRLPDGRIVFNRRSQTASDSPGLLAFYGGHVDEGENTAQAAKREIVEETSINTTKLSFRFLGEYKVREVADKMFFLYEIPVLDDKFNVYEGDGSEVYLRKEVLARNDITPSVRYALENIVED